MYRAGKHKAKVRTGREWLPVATGVPDDDGKEIEVPIKDVALYVDEFFYSALSLYNDCILFGDVGTSLPFAGGWADQPYIIYRVLQTLLAEAKKIEAEEWEQSKKK